MRQFSLERQQAKLEHLNVRAEKHGDDTVPAADVKVSFKAPNDILSEFDPALKAALYRKPDAPEDPKQAELLEEPGYLPKLRFPKLPAIKWAAEITGARVTVHYGLGGESDIVLEDAIVDAFAFGLQDGGTVIVTLRVKAHPTDQQIGKLYSQVARQIEISIEPPIESNLDLTAVADDGKRPAGRPFPQRQAAEPAEVQ